MWKGLEMKIYKKEIEGCWFCPACCSDMNGTRWECREHHRKQICWQGDDKEEQNYIPDWCPLPEKEELFDI
jgi:hypothetical protein